MYSNKHWLAMASVEGVAKQRPMITQKNTEGAELCCQVVCFRAQVTFQNKGKQESCPFRENPEGEHQVISCVKAQAQLHYVLD